MTDLTYKTCWRAPGYRDLRLVLVDPATGKEYELRLAPKDVQTLIFEFAEAAQQIGDQPPIDWDTYTDLLADDHTLEARSRRGKRVSG